MVDDALVCGETGCPLATEGKCLEGFSPPDTCPHARAKSASDVDPAAETVDDIIEEPDAGELDDAEDERVEAARWVDLGGDVALTLNEADEFAAHAPSQVILVAGEFESGKTTLVVELYARFLQGSFSATEFGGSRTLRALDKRHHPAREKSGRPTPKTERTSDEDMRLLHLRLRRHGRVHDLLFSDVKGEFFEDIVDAAGAVRQVPLASRADLCLLLVDGAAIADAVERQSAVTRARLLLGGLAEQGGLKPGTRTVIVLTKVDLIEPTDRSWGEAQVRALCEWALGRGLAATALFIAARPLNGQPQGLDLLLDQVLPMPQPLVVPPPPVTPGDRQFWNQPENVL